VFPSAGRAVHGRQREGNPSKEVEDGFSVGLRDGVEGRRLGLSSVGAAGLKASAGGLGCRLYTCRVCRRKWSDLTGTIFERTRTPLSSWFLALYEIAHGPGTSARHLQERLSVSYKTAWRMLHRIRACPLHPPFGRDGGSG